MVEHLTTAFFAMIAGTQNFVITLYAITVTVDSVPSALPSVKISRKRNAQNCKNRLTSAMVVKSKKAAGLRKQYILQASHKSNTKRCVPNPEAVSRSMNQKHSGWMA